MLTDICSSISLNPVPVPGPLASRGLKWAPSCLRRTFQVCSLDIIGACYTRNGISGLTILDSIPGKTTPRLVLDIHQYDPAHPPASGRNLLSEVPPVFDSGYHGPMEYISPKACSHQYVTKVNQNTVSTGAPSKLFAICTKCRRHLQVTVTNPDTVGQQYQGFTSHIHHLVCKGGQFGKAGQTVTTKEQIVEVFHYECSYFTCSTRVSVSVASPILSEYWVWMLTDNELQNTRTQDAISTFPDRLEGVGKPLAIEVLKNLRTYIVNALRHQSSKPITAINKRFMTSFGVRGLPCRKLLEFLEFTYKVCKL